jgi:hypothetical protein
MHRHEMQLSNIYLGIL